MRAAYMQRLKEKQQQVEDKGNYKGYSNEHVPDLMRVDPHGPLDYSNNEGRQDALNYKI